MDEREFLLLIRQALLLMVDAIERKLNMQRTAQLRRASACENGEA